MAAHVRLALLTEKSSETVMQSFPPSICRKVAKTLFRDVVAACYLFRSCSPHFVNELAGEVKVEYFMPGEVVLSQNNAGDQMYIVKDGVVEEIEDRPNIGHVVMSAVFAGDSFGEVAVLCNIPQQSSVRVRELCQLLRIEKQMFSSLLASHPNDEKQVMHNLQQRETYEGESTKSALTSQITSTISQMQTKLITAMVATASRGDVEFMKSLLQRGADATVVDYSGRTALHLAAARGFDDICRILLDHGAEVNAKDNFGATPLLEAIRHGHDHTAMLLDTYGARVALAEPATELCNAVDRGDHDYLQRLLLHGVDPNCADYDLRTPLHVAASEGLVFATRTLIANGADVFARDRWGHTPLDEALASGSKPAFKLLEAAMTAAKAPLTASQPLGPMAEENATASSNEGSGGGKRQVQFGLVMRHSNSWSTSGKGGERKTLNGNAAGGEVLSHPLSPNVEDAMDKETDKNDEVEPMVEGSAGDGGGDDDRGPDQIAIQGKSTSATSRYLTDYFLRPGRSMAESSKGSPTSTPAENASEESSRRLLSSVQRWLGQKSADEENVPTPRRRESKAKQESSARRRRNFWDLAGQLDPDWSESGRSGDEERDMRQETHVEVMLGDDFERIDYGGSDFDSSVRPKTKTERNIGGSLVPQRNRVSGRMGNWQGERKEREELGEGRNDVDEAVANPSRSGVFRSLMLQGKTSGDGSYARQLLAGVPERETATATAALLDLDTVIEGESGTPTSRDAITRGSGSRPEKQSHRVGASTVARDPLAETLDVQIELPRRTFDADYRNVTSTNSKIKSLRDESRSTALRRLNSPGGLSGVLTSPSSRRLVSGALEPIGVSESKAIPRVTLFPHHPWVDAKERRPGRLMYLPSTLEEFFTAGRKHFGKEAAHLFLANGGEIFAIELIRDGDDVYLASEDEAVQAEAPLCRHCNR